tara:strand:+ start:713 stop:1288 length:576 start_codon:yes stop_codon:yes gene_type:complete
MRIFFKLIILILSFQSSAKADDIKDFAIHGISVGDSLLDFYNADEIYKNIDPNVYKNKDKKFVLAGFYGKFGEYDGLQFAIKPNDKKLIIYGINGGVFFSNINECNIERKSIRKELSLLFKDATTNFDDKIIHSADSTGKSFVISDGFFLNSGSASVKCFNWSDEITKKYGWADNLRVGVKLKEYNDWLKD